MDNRKNILITGGGTGGHLSIAKAVAEALLKDGHQPIYVGSTKGQDREWFEDSPLFAKTYFLESSGVVNKKNPLNKLKSLLNILKLSFVCKKIFKEHTIDTVFSVGGFSAAPAAIAAVLGSQKLYIHEQNSKMGSLNKLLKPFATALFSSYLPNSKIKDYPVSDIFFEYARPRDTVKTVIFLGGSQGARFVNDLAMNLAPDLKRQGIHIIHQCGGKDYDRVQAYYEKEGLEVELYGFHKQLWELMAKADFAISRAGASSLWELSANALPAFFIPYPYAASDHQYYNALFLEEKNAGFLSRQNELKRHKLFEIIKRGVKQESEQLQALIGKGGAEKIAQFMLA